MAVIDSPGYASLADLSSPAAERDKKSKFLLCLVPVQVFTLER